MPWLCLASQMSARGSSTARRPQRQAATEIALCAPRAVPTLNLGLVRDEDDPCYP